MEERNADRPDPSANAALAALLLVTFAIRALYPNQPIVENYVGRQVPTAMVARNLERGSGFLRPQLDTAPLPNLFLVEPPLYAQAVVALRAITGMALEPAGRWVSALGITLGAWGLFGLARRREGTRTALFAVAALAVFPVTIRYGRAFQPDALMLGTLLVALRCWDEHEAGGPPGWLAAGWLLLAASFALKVTAAYALVPLLGVIARPPRARKVVLAVSTLAPAVLWYAYAAWRLRQGEGSRASADNGAIWLRTLVPDALFRAATLGHIVRFTVVRAFTPLGFALAVFGLWPRFHSRPTESPERAQCELGALPPGSHCAPSGLRRKNRRGTWFLGRCPRRLHCAPSGLEWKHRKSARVPAPSDETPHKGEGSKAPCPPGLGVQSKALAESADVPNHPGRLWTVWGLAAVAGLLVLAAKLHHEYYWLALAPLAAVGVGRSLEAVRSRSRAGVILLGGALVVLSLIQARSTWGTPQEWSSLSQAARAVQAKVSEDVWIVAPEALLYAADRRGCRLELTRAAARRAAGEWGETDLPDGPLALIEFYRTHGARFVADVAAGGDSNRLALHRAIRARYNVLVDTPGVLLAALTDRPDVSEDADASH